MFFRFLILFFSISLAFTPLVFAHHTSGHGTASSSLFFNPFSNFSRPPRSFIDFLYTVDQLDENVGEIFTLQLSGEYAFTRRVSAGSRVPFVMVRDQLIPSASSIGDVAAYVKGVVWQDLDRVFIISVGTEVSFPTGEASKGLGIGNFLFSPYLNVSKGFGPFQFFTTLGSSIAASDTPAPSFDYLLGTTIPIVKKGMPIDLLLSFQGSTAFSSSVFSFGSTKTFFKPGLILHLQENLLLTLGGKLSVIDTLQIKKGVRLATNSPLLLTDIFSGFVLDVNYSF